MKTFGEDLRYFRALNKFSQKEFALKMQTTQQRVSEWECDRVEPSLYNIIKILKIFGITFEELVEGMNEK